MALPGKSAYLLACSFLNSSSSFSESPSLIALPNLSKVSASSLAFSAVSSLSLHESRISLATAGTPRNVLAKTSVSFP